MADAYRHVYIATESALFVWDHDRLRLLRTLPHNTRNITVLNMVQGKLTVCSGNLLLTLATSAGKDPVVTDSVALSFRGEGLSPLTFLPDYRGNLWVTAPGKLCILLRDRLGRVSNDRKLLLIHQGADAPRTGFTATGHKLIFRTRSLGYVYVDVDSFLSRCIHSDLLGPYLTDVQLSHHAVDWAAIGEVPLTNGLPACPRLGYHNNNLSFLFSAISPFYPEYLVYQYRLDGFDTGWLPPQAAGRAEYTALPPGRYHLRLRAADVRGGWTERSVWQFIILPPWWRTWWAYALWALLAAGLVALLFRLRLRMLQRRLEVEKVVMEHELKAIRAQINPHFLQNTFDFLARRALLDTHEHMLNALKQVSGYLRGVLYRSDKTLVTLEEEIEAVREYWAMQQILLRQGFEAIIRVDDAVDTFGMMLPAMLLQPIAENAIKYGTKAGRAGKYCGWM